MTQQPEKAEQVSSPHVAAPPSPAVVEPPTCPVCHEFLFGATVGSSCGHCLCLFCSDRLIGQSCPLCRSVTRFVPNFELRDLARRLWPELWAHKMSAHATRPEITVLEEIKARRGGLVFGCTVGTFPLEEWIKFTRMADAVHDLSRQEALTALREQLQRYRYHYVALAEACNNEVLYFGTQFNLPFAVHAFVLGKRAYWIGHSTD